METMLFAYTLKIVKRKGFFDNSDENFESALKTLTQSQLAVGSIPKKHCILARKLLELGSINCFREKRTNTLND